MKHIAQRMKPSSVSSFCITRHWEVRAISLVLRFYLDPAPFSSVIPMRLKFAKCAMKSIYFSQLTCFHCLWLFQTCLKINNQQKDELNERLKHQNVISHHVADSWMGMPTVPRKWWTMFRTDPLPYLPALLFLLLTQLSSVLFWSFGYL
jgi:hypothetical protein